MQAVAELYEQTHTHPCAASSHQSRSNGAEIFQPWLMHPDHFQRAALNIP